MFVKASCGSLKLYLLGGCDIHFDAQPVAGMAYSKMRALLAYLAVECDREHRREVLAELFWGGNEEARARGNLRRTLTDLRRVLELPTGLALFAADKNSIRFVANADVDAVAFAKSAVVAGSSDAAAQRDHDEALLASYRGDFLAGLSLPDCPEFENWLQVKRESLHCRALALLEKLINDYQQSGDFSRALGHAGRYLELDPWNEGAHRKMMVLLAQAGQQGAALAQYESCRRMLDYEFDLLPDPQTIELFEKIKAGGLSAELAKAAMPSPFSYLGKNVSGVLSKSLRILIVDDHLLFRAGLCMMLNELGSAVTVVEAASCEAALEVAASATPFDIILLDLKLPGMSGLDGLLLFQQRFAGVPVVLLSADEDCAAIQASIERGARGYLSKGMDAPTITEAIEQVLAGGSAFPFGFVTG